MSCHGRALRRAAWCEVEPQRVGVDGHSQIEDAKAAGACELADSGEVLGANFRVEQIHLSRLESQQLGVLGRDHTQRERGPAWRLGVQAGGEPVWIAGELQTLTGAGTTGGRMVPARRARPAVS